MAGNYSWGFDPDGDRHSDAERYGYVSKSGGFQRYSDRPLAPSITALLVPGGSNHEIYQQRRDCGVLRADFELAKRCQENAHVKIVELAKVRETGIACVMCLPQEARDRHVGALLKPCVISSQTRSKEAVLLHWRKDRDKAWFGIVVYEEDGELSREIVPAQELNVR